LSALSKYCQTGTWLFAKQWLSIGANKLLAIATLSYRRHSRYTLPRPDVSSAGAFPRNRPLYCDVRVKN